MTHDDVISPGDALKCPFLVNKKEIILIFFKKLFQKKVLIKTINNFRNRKMKVYNLSRTAVRTLASTAPQQINHLPLQFGLGNWWSYVGKVKDQADIGTCSKYSKFMNHTNRLTLIRQSWKENPKCGTITERVWWVKSSSVG